MAFADTANLAVKLTLDDRAFSGPLSRVQRNLGGLNKGFGRMGRGVGQLGAGFARVGYIAATAAAGGLALVAREGIKWESALAGVNKTMDLTPAELSAIGTDIRKLAVQIPIGADAIAGLAEQAGALGIAKQDVVEFARVAATLGVTTNVSADEAASALGGMSTILGLTGDEFERFASALVDLGNKGASSEDQILSIAERIAGGGATIGLSTEEILGFSAAVANIKIPAEAAGSSLQKFFLETLKAVNAGGADLDTFAKTAGVTADSFAAMFKDDPAAALESFVQGLSGLGKGQRLNVLDDLGFSDIRITRMLLGLAEAEKNNDNLSDSLNVSADAWAANTAAAAEADKRYKTVGSKLELLKNQAIEGALLIGEGFLPALGRLADKIGVVLANDEQRKVFTDFGKDIGKIIDGIDFNKVVSGAKAFLGVARTIWSILSKIPIEIHAAVLGFAALNTASGGLIGSGFANLIGGLGETVIRGLGSQLPGVGKLFAQPVIVTNWPPGFGMGAGGGAVPGAKGIGALGKLFLIGESIGLILAVKGVADAVTGAALIQAQSVHNTLTESLANPQTPADLTQKLAGVNNAISSINALGNIPAALFHDTLVELETMRTQIVNAIRVQTYQDKTAREDTPAGGLPPSPEVQKRLALVGSAVGGLKVAVKSGNDRLGAKLEAARAAIKIGNQGMTQEQRATKAAVNVAKAAIRFGASNDASRIVNAIFAARPMVNVVVNAATHYTTTVTTGQTRTGMNEFGGGKRGAR